VSEEQPIDPGRPIVDPHHHLWDFGAIPGGGPGPRAFLLPDMLQTIGESGHNIVRTVYVECHAMYRKEGPSEMRSIGETEFANGMAAMSASGRYGDCRIAAGIVGNVDLRLGEKVAPVLEAQVAAGNGRLRGIRMPTVYADVEVFGRASDPAFRGLMMDAKFRAGVAALERFGLTLDVWCFHSQLGELASLAAACPNIVIVLDHVGTPLLSRAERARAAEVMSSWRRGIGELARRPNVRAKLGGLGMNLVAPIGGERGTATSQELAGEWRPYIEGCIEAFGPGRCMFESNFPADSACAYGALWNAFKLIAADYSDAEKTRLFSGTADEVYRLR
jgi:L-fuconolactonase